MAGYQLPLSLTPPAVSREALALHIAQAISKMTEDKLLQAPEALHSLLPTRSMRTLGSRVVGRQEQLALRACAILKMASLEGPRGESWPMAAGVFWFKEQLCTVVVSVFKTLKVKKICQSHRRCLSFFRLVDQIFTHPTEKQFPVLEKKSGVACAVPAGKHSTATSLLCAGGGASQARFP